MMDSVREQKYQNASHSCSSSPTLFPFCLFFPHYPSPFLSTCSRLASIPFFPIPLPLPCLPFSVSTPSNLLHMPMKKIHSALLHQGHPGSGSEHLSTQKGAWNPVCFHGRASVHLDSASLPGGSNSSAVHFHSHLPPNPSANV